MRFLAKILVIFGSCLSCFVESSEHNATAKDPSVILEALLLNYDERVRPNANGGPPVMVACNMEISSFGSVTETTMDYSVTMYLRQNWNDPRLAFNDIDNETDVVTVSSKVREKIWLPDLYYVNVKDAYFHTVTMDNVLLRIFNNGDVLYSIRLSLRLSCEMSLINFPMDSQVCSVIAGSYGFSTDELQLDWKYGNDSVYLQESIKLPQFTITDMILKKKTDHFVTGSFDVLQVDFYLSRELGYYILQTFVPSTLLVVLSWVSFLIDPSAAPARVALGITTVLTLTTQSSGVKADLPKVAYAKAIDVWMAVCLVFVFGALVEFSIVNYLGTNKKRKDQKRKEEENCNESPVSHRDGWVGKETTNKSDFVKIPTEENTRTCACTKFSCTHDAAHICDRASLVLFPAAFLVFNVAYWTYYI